MANYLSLYCTLISLKSNTIASRGTILDYPVVKWNCFHASACHAQAELKTDRLPGISVLTPLLPSWVYKAGVSWKKRDCNRDVSHIVG